MLKAELVIALVLATGCKTREQQDQAIADNPAALPEGTLIPRSMEGDKGTYYLLEAHRAGDVVQALHKRVGVDSVGWTKTETNCKTMRMRELGYSEESASAVGGEPTKWFELVPGSSKSDLGHFVCNH